MQEPRLKNAVMALRKEGFSYNMISSRLGIAKGTLSSWLKDVPYRPNKVVRSRIKFGLLKSAQARHNKKVQEIIEAKKTAKHELGKLTKRDLWLLGLGLYIGEGSKLYESIRIINSDPRIIKLAIVWLEESCGLTTENITVAIHLYPDNDAAECLRFWSRELNLPIRQFRKTQIDTRTNKSGKKKRKLPYGTAHITVVSKGDAARGVKLHRRIMGWIEATLKQAESRGIS